MKKKKTIPNNKIIEVTNSDIIEEVLKKGWSEEIDYFGETDQETERFSNIVSTWDKYIAYFYGSKNELIEKYEIYAQDPKTAWNAFTTEIKYSTLFSESTKWLIELHPRPYEIFWS